MKAAQLIRKGGALLISDYGFGTATPATVRLVRKGARSKSVATLDSRYALAEYRGAGLTAATPNESELEALYHTRIGNDAAKLERVGKSTIRMLGLEALLVTRGSDGMVLFERGKPPTAIPIYGSDEVADVTGAGDTVIAVFTMALAAGASFYEAAVLANYAGGIVVMKRGTAMVTQGGTFRSPAKRGHRHRERLAFENKMTAQPPPAARTKILNRLELKRPPGGAQEWRREDRAGERML